MDSLPAMLTIALIRKHYLPLGGRTLRRWISAGAFPKADLAQGAKIRLWRKETVEVWLAEHAGEVAQAQSRNTNDAAPTMPRVPDSEEARAARRAPDGQSGLRKFLSRVWNDPVWSKVIAAGLRALWVWLSHG